MRQRLLLLAGWVIAAIGSVLVATAAVGIAGGQVTDRPLRPLTASEVAALPIRATTDLAANEPLASGGGVPTTGVIVDGARATDPTDDLTGGGGVENIGSDFPSEDDPEALIPPAPPQDPAADRGPTSPPSGLVGRATEVVQVRGGTASFAVAGDVVDLQWATPRPGFVVTISRTQPDVIMVIFESSFHRSTIHAFVDTDDDGAPAVAIEVDEERF